MELKYSKVEKVNLRDHHDEKWLQDRIEEDTSLLGIGDVTIIQRERRQPTGGRIDFLLHDPETQTMYETEIMLGATDESHIIRTIEYWDIERRRFPSRDHKAVIVAEEITNRFFNVISLMNRSIPIIAIQLNAIKLEDKMALVFTKVLDTYQPPEDVEEIEGETVDRAYWQSRSNPKSIAIMDELIGIAETIEPNKRVTYNKHHVALGTTRRNFAWFHPRKKEGYCHFNIRVGKDNLERAKEALEEVAISFSHRKDDLIAISLQRKEFKENKEAISNIIKSSVEAYQ